MFIALKCKLCVQKYSQVFFCFVFLDALKSKVTAVDWPFYPVAVVDKENTLYIIAFACGFKRAMRLIPE